MALENRAAVTIPPTPVPSPQPAEDAPQILILLFLHCSQVLHLIFAGHPFETVVQGV